MAEVNAGNTGKAANPNDFKALEINPDWEFGEQNGVIQVKGNVVAILFRTDRTVFTTDKGTKMCFGIPRGYIPDGTSVGMQCSAWLVKPRSANARPPVRVIK